MTNLIVFGGESIHLRSRAAEVNYGAEEEEEEVMSEDIIRVSD